MFTFRPFDYDSDRDYARAVEINNASWPLYPDTVAEWRHWDSTRNPKYYFSRNLILRGDEIVGLCTVGEPAWTHKPGKYFIGITVHPTYRGQGAGGAAYEYALSLLAGREPAPAVLTGNTREDRPVAIRFMEKRGFQQVMRYPRSHLHLVDFDPEPFAAKVRRVLESGIEIVSLDVLQERDPAWMRHYYEMSEQKIMRDVPLPDPFTPPTLEEFEKRFIENPHFDPSLQFIALDGETWAGMSGLHRPAVYTGMLHTGLTGLLRPYRRRGIATALKVTALSHAKAIGAEVIETDNEENNPMFQLNMKLGFKPQPAWLDFHKEL